MPKCSSPRLSSTGSGRAAAGSRYAGRFRRFAIFGSGRCGSSLLVDLLNSQPLVSCDFLLTEFRNLISNYSEIMRFVEEKGLAELITSWPDNAPAQPRGG